MIFTAWQMGADGLPSPPRLGHGVCLHLRAGRRCAFTISLTQTCRAPEVPRWWLAGGIFCEACRWLWERTRQTVVTADSSVTVSCAPAPRAGAQKKRRARQGGSRAGVGAGHTRPAAPGDVTSLRTAAPMHAASAA